MSAEENKALVRRFFEAQLQGDLDALKEMMAQDFVDHSVLPDEEADREGYIRAVAKDRAAFSTVRRIVEYQVATDDTVVSRLTLSGTHNRGEIAGIVPTGTELLYTAIVINRIVGGKIAEEWSEGSGLAEITQRRLEQEMRERERVEQELRVAHRIQQASLPRAMPKLEGWEITHHYLPARQVGGDFYDFHPLSDDRLGIIIGDATGKGVPAALVMATTCGMLRAVAQSADYSPGAVLERVNETLFPNIPSNMFVTCFYAILDPESGRLLYANAGHNLPCCRHEHASIELRARGMPLGLMPGMSYEEKETILEVGDRALFYSDGLVEAHDPRGEMFGFPRLEGLVAEHDEEEEGSLVDSLLEALKRFTGEDWEQEDDITLLTLERSASLS